MLNDDYDMTIKQFDFSLGSNSTTAKDDSKAVLVENPIDKAPLLSSSSKVNSAITDWYQSLDSGDILKLLEVVEDDIILELASIRDFYEEKRAPYLSSTR